MSRSSNHIQISQGETKSSTEKVQKKTEKNNSEADIKLEDVLSSGQSVDMISSFGYRWSLFYTIAASCTLFTTTFQFAATLEDFTNFRGFDLFTEIIFLLDLLFVFLYYKVYLPSFEGPVFRCFHKNYQIHPSDAPPQREKSEQDLRQLLKLKESYYFQTSKSLMFFKILSSIPTSIIFTSLEDRGIINLNDQSTNHLFTYIQQVKILKIIECLVFSSRVEHLLAQINISKLIVLKIFKNLLLLFLFLHCGACLWIWSNNLLKQDGDQNAYFLRKYQDKGLGFKYVVSLEWAVDAMVGNCFGDATPRGLKIQGMNLLYIVMGAIFSAVIFASFESIMGITRSEIVTKQITFEQTQLLSVQRGLNPLIRQKIKNFYVDFEEGYEMQQNFELIRLLPQSLFIELQLFLNNDLIRKVQLFNMGNPDFVITLFHHLHLSVCLERDLITHAGEEGETFYIIKSGRVEVLSADSRVVLAVLEEGAYFGEVSLLGLNNGKRSATIRALSNCVLLGIGREKFLQVLDQFPDHREYLKKVAYQRWSTSEPDDVPDYLLPYVPYNEIEGFLLNKKNDPSQYFKQFLPDVKEQLRELRSKRNTREESQKKLVSNGLDLHQVKNRFYQDLTDKIYELDFGASLIIPTRHAFYSIWKVIIYGVVAYNIFYVPFSLCFDFDFKGVYFLLDVLAILVQLADIFVRLATLRFDESGNPIKDHAQTVKWYIDHHLFYDVIAVFPIDILLLQLGVSTEIYRFLRAMRLFKILRLLDYANAPKREVTTGSIYNKLITLALYYFLFNHLAACVLYLVTVHQNITGNGDPDVRETMGEVMNQLINDSQKPFLEQSKLSLYVFYLNWSLQASTTGSYGDIFAVSMAEKIVSLFVTLFFKVYVVFIFSEISYLSSTHKSPLSMHQEKLSILMQWMRNNNLPKNLVRRMREHMVYHWTKFNGTEDTELTSFLPATLQSEIALQVMGQVIERHFEPDPANPETVGQMLGLIRGCRTVLIPSGEYVFVKGEMAQEMYFILEGLVEIEGDGTIYHAELRKSDFFGEECLTEKRLTRHQSIRARKDLWLARLDVEKFRQIEEVYPGVVAAIKEQSIKKYALLRSKNPMADLMQSKNKASRSPKKSGLSPKRQGELSPQPHRNNDSAQVELVKSVEIPPQNHVRLNMAQGFETKEDPSLSSMHNETPNNRLNARREELVSSAGGGSKRKFLGSLRAQAQQKRSQFSHVGLTLSVGELPGAKLTPLQRFYQENAISDQEALEEPYRVVVQQVPNDHQPKQESVHAFSQQLLLENRITPSGEQLQQSQLSRDLQLQQPFQESIQSVSIGDQEPSLERRTLKFLVRKGRLLFSLCREEIFTLKSGSLTYFLVMLWSVLFIPVHMCFLEVSYRTSAVLVVIEVLSSLFLLARAARVYLDFLQSRRHQILVNLDEEVYTLDAQKDREIQRRTLREISYLVFISLPFQLIITTSLEEEELSAIQRSLLYLFQLARVTHLQSIYDFISRVFINNVALQNLAKLTFTVLLQQHYTACFLILIGRLQPVYEETWLNFIPDYYFNQEGALSITQKRQSPHNIYVCALYWSFVTTAHVGVGDVPTRTIVEKFYGILIMGLSCFTNAYFFGNLASMVDEITPTIKKEFDSKYDRVIEALKSCNIYDKFIQRVDSYFNFIWIRSLGLNENEILDFLPPSLKADILKHIYKPIFRNSYFFQIGGVYNPHLASSILKVAEIETYLVGDTIIIAGDLCNEVYLVLEGEAEVVSFEKKKFRNILMSPGQFFGSLNVPSERQACYIQASKITKLARIALTDFVSLGAAFPEWKTSVQRYFNERRFQSLQGLRYLEAKRISLGGLDQGEYFEIPADVMDFYRQETADYLVSEDELTGSLRGSIRQKSVSGVPGGGITPKDPRRDARRDLKQDSERENPNQIKPVYDFRQLWRAFRLVFLLRRQNFYFLFHQNGTVRYFFDAVQLVFILYSSFLQPYIIGFNIELNFTVVLLETLYFLQQLIMIFVRSRTPYYNEGVQIQNREEIFRNYRNSRLFAQDLVCLIPLNLLLQLLQLQLNISGKNYSGVMLLFLPFRLSRLVKVQEIFSLITKFENRFRNLKAVFTISRSIIILLLVWHLYACAFYFFISNFQSESPVSWYQINAIGERTYFENYIFCMFQFIVVAATIGYSEVMIYTPSERVFMMLQVLGGNALFAIGFGIMASQMSIIPEKLVGIFQYYTKIEQLMKKNEVPSIIQRRINQFRQFQVQGQNQQQQILHSIQSLVPKSMYSDLVYENAKSFLKKFKILQEFNSPVIMRKIANILNPQIFLENDYIIVKDEVGEEMFFVISGCVAVLSLDEESVLVKLPQGSYIGEVALFAKDSKRMCSIIAASLTQVYVLSKNDLEGIFNIFPLLKQKFIEEGQRRVQDFNNKQTENKRNKSEKRSLIRGKPKIQGLSHRSGGSSSRAESLKHNSSKGNFSGDDLESGPEMEQKSHHLGLDYLKLLPKPRSRYMAFKEKLKILKNGKRSSHVSSQKPAGKRNYEQLLKKVSYLKKKNYLQIRKILYLGQDHHIDDLEQKEDPNLSLEETVQGDEFQNINSMKNSRRRPQEAPRKERRLSRILLSRQKAISKNSSVKLNWSINLSFSEKQNLFNFSSDDQD